MFPCAESGSASLSRTDRLFAGFNLLYEPEITRTVLDETVREAKLGGSAALSWRIAPNEIGAFVEHYNHIRYHESIDNLTPADVYFGRAATILAERRRIKLATIANRRLQHRLQAA